VYGSAVDVIRKVVREEGVRGFYKGWVGSKCFQGWKDSSLLTIFFFSLGPNLIRVLPSTCVTFLVYENVKFHLPKA
jgi:solute carrier family 25 folate transporter 32